MIKEEEDYIIHELDEEAINVQREAGEEGRDIVTDNPTETYIEMESYGVCWNVKAFKICVRKIEASRIILDVYLVNQKIGTIVLTKTKPCVKISKSLLGDTARVKANICVNFTKREVRTEGRVCALFACVKFNARVVKW